MRKSFRTLIVACAMLLAPALAQAQTPTAPADPSARVIVKYKADSPLLRKRAQTVAAQHATQAQTLGARVGMALRPGAGLAEQMQVLFANGMTSAQLAQRLAAESDIEYAVPDERRRHFSAPNDPLYAAGPAVSGGTGGPAVGQWYLRAPAGDVRSSVNVETAWSVTTGSPGIVVAVIDTGVRFDHPDLLRVAAGGNLLPGYDMISDIDVANDGDGRDADPSDPGDWVTLAEIQQRGGPFYQCDTAASDSSWHGTQTSGLVGALTQDGIGMASVGRNVRVLPVRALGKCGGYDSDIIAGMRWAAGLSVPGVPANPNPARVISLSLGGEGACTAAYRDAVAAVNAAGALVVVAAGNTVGHAVGTPANCAGVIAVAGLRHVGTKVGYSDLGPEISIAAPAGNCVNTAVGAPCLFPILTTANRGLTVPISDAAGGSIYTDSFNTSLGTSFSAPLVAGTVGLMLSARPALAPADVRRLLQATARPFPTTGGDNGNGTPVPQCTAPQPLGATQVDQLQCYCTTSTCGAGMLDAGAAVLAAQANGAPNYTGLFWTAPAGSESGWGLTVFHQGDVIFLGWFTYDANGKTWWLSMTAPKTAANTYTGALIQSSGPAFSAVPFDPANVMRTVVGSATLTFSDVGNGSFAYTVNTITGPVSQTKPITRVAYGAAPTCTYGPQPDFPNATNYQDVWWVTGGAEGGWGLALTHQGDTIFAGWFTYDGDGTPLWLSASALKSGTGVYSGSLIRTTGPVFNALPWDPNRVIRTPVGTMSLAFANGNSGTFSYTVNTVNGPVTQTKTLTRALFAPPAGTLCQ